MATNMFTITEDDNSAVSSHQSPSNKYSFDAAGSIESQGDQSLTLEFQTEPVPTPLNISSDDDRCFIDEDFGPPTGDYSLNFFAESPASSSPNTNDREVFQSGKGNNNVGRRPLSANNHQRPFQPADHSSHSVHRSSTRPSSASNARTSSSPGPKLSSVGKSASFENDFMGESKKTVFAPLNDLKEQRRNLDTLPRSERLVRRMGSPLGITLLQLDERDMLVARDESWHLSNKGRVQNHDRMYRPHHKEADKTRHNSNPPSRPLTGNPKSFSHAESLPNRRPLSASARVQRSGEWQQDGGTESKKRVEWSEVSGIVDDDGEDGENGWLSDYSVDEPKSSSQRGSYNKKDDHDISYSTVSRRQVDSHKNHSHRVNQLASALLTELHQMSLAEVWDKVLDPSRRGYFGLPELVQVMSVSGLRCTLVEAEGILGKIGGERNMTGRVSFAQFQRFYNSEDGGRVSDANHFKTKAKTSQSAVSSSDLNSLLASLELRASKLKFPGDRVEEENQQPIRSGGIAGGKGKVSKKKSKNGKVSTGFKGMVLI